MNNDQSINNKDVVCLGYRWPSEGMWTPIGSTFTAAPQFLKILFFIGILALFPEWHEHLHSKIGHRLAFIFTVFPAALVFLPITLILLRIGVYFRDGYRATSYGIPDLVEVIRLIDRELMRRDLSSHQVKLSFIGHSMGAYIVTSVVRILSDVFDPETMRDSLNNTGTRPSAPNKLPQVGHAFTLERLVLVSPDIPAEALIANRANFLQNSLKRFKEAYLFSNEGDEVLRQLSTSANYFSFPTRRIDYSHRLGNICLLGVPYGISKGVNLSYLQIGHKTLAKIYDELCDKAPEQFGDSLPSLFSYFDCTDCVDIDINDGKTRGMLTLAKPGPVKKMMPYQHFWLLLCYLWNRKPDVHGGYFQSKFVSELVYRLAIIGYVNTELAYGGQVQLHQQLIRHQIKTLLK